MNSESMSDRIQRRCEAYEQAASEGRQPELARFLSGSTGKEREELFSSLLKIDLRTSQNLDPTTYLNQFPEFENLIRKVFESVKADKAKATLRQTLQPGRDASIATPASALDKTQDSKLVASEPARLTAVDNSPIVPISPEVSSDLVERARLTAIDDGSALASAESLGFETINTGTDSAFSSGRHTADSLIPNNLGHYTIIKVLGRGGMGAVYLASDPRLNRQVAIKMPFLDSELATDSEAIISRFSREARALAAIVHPNICPIHEVNFQDGVPYIVMTFVEGRTLSNYFKEMKPAPITTVVQFIRKLAVALHHAHRAGVIHRDLKPSNILVNYLDEPVIIDFGLAVAQNITDEKALDEDMMGTPYYMSPEQVNGRMEAVSERSDIYSLGVILWELLTGELPFKGKSVPEVLMKVVNVQPPKPSAIRSEVDAEMDSICLKALEKKPEKRFQNMLEFSKVLENYLNSSQTALPATDTTGRGQTIRAGLTKADTKHRTDAPSRIQSALQSGSVSADFGSAIIPDEAISSTVESEQGLVPEDNGYRLVELLGRGQYGEVWRALAPGGVEVAVKKLLFPAKHKATQIELQALELIKRLRHPLLLQVQAYWIVGDQLLIVMELADNSLEDVLKKTGQPIPREQLLRYMAETAEAIDFLHAKGVLHRDIKPANILLVQDHVKVADFGIATSGVINPTKLTVASAVLGTPMYMAPELWQKQAGPRSDQYSLAVTYVELRLGKEPQFDKKDSSLLNELPEKERRVVARALSPKSSDRFESCREFIGALEDLVRQEKRAAELKVLRRRQFITSTGVLVVGVPAAVLFFRSDLWNGTPRLPEGYLPAQDAVRVKSGGAVYFDRIVRKLPSGTEVEFRLIPKSDKAEVDPFYCMPQKVSNKLFSEFAANQSDLQSDSWKRGALAGDAWLSAADHPQLPALSITFEDARKFAKWLGGDLPTIDQWDKAAGRFDAPADRVGPFEPQRNAPGQVAILQSQQGPSPVGTAEGDVSIYGCRDMSGNGQEWTRMRASLPPVEMTSEVDSTDEISIVVRGRDYRADRALEFADLVDLESSPYRPSNDPDPICVRCVIDFVE